MNKYIQENLVLSYVRHLEKLSEEDRKKEILKMLRQEDKKYKIRK